MKTVYYSGRIYLNVINKEEHLIDSIRKEYYERYLSTLTSYPITPLEHWKDGDEIIEGKNYKFINKPFTPSAVAIPVKQNDTMKTVTEQIIEKITFVKNLCEDKPDEMHLQHVMKQLLADVEDIIELSASHPSGKAGGVWVKTNEHKPKKYILMPLKIWSGENDFFYGTGDYRDGYFVEEHKGSFQESIVEYLDETQSAMPVEETEPDRTAEEIWEDNCEVVDDSDSGVMFINKERFLAAMSSYKSLDRSQEVAGDWQKTKDEATKALADKLDNPNNQ